MSGPVPFIGGKGGSIMGGGKGGSIMGGGIIGGCGWGGIISGGIRPISLATSSLCYKQKSHSLSRKISFLVPECLCNAIFCES